jgi:hypothetical protein
MTPWAHRIFISVLVGIGFTTLIILVYWGFSYYITTVEERPFHENHTVLKPSGPVGHGLGILGTLMILIGVFSYIGRKKKIFLPRVGALKHWLEFHIFLCSVGPLLILFHTAFKFGGLVSISFWSMVAVVLSGVIGRFIYIQIPRTIQGRELSLSEIQESKDTMSQSMRKKYGFDELTFNQFISATQEKLDHGDAGFWKRVQNRYRYDRQIKNKVRAMFRENQLSRKDRRGIMKVVRHEMTLNARIQRLQLMQKLFKYWHVAHLPFALVMLVIMVIHVAITLVFGYRWIF